MRLRNRRTPYNISLDTDLQMQEAASRRVLRSGQLRRYAAMSRYLIVSLILSSSATIGANAQGIALSKIAECTCTAHSNQAICLKSKSDDPPCVMFYPDQFGQETEAIVNLQGRFLKIYRRPRSPEVNYSNWVFKSADGSVIVTLNASAVDDCSRFADCAGATFRGVLTAVSGKAKKRYQVEFYRGG